MLFLVSTILLTAIVLPNLIFKEHWGRPRPVATTEFNGPHAFTPWWDPRGANEHNGSFFSGEAATAFWTYAPAALAPRWLRPMAFVGATAFGLTTGLLRMAFGAHFASDIVAAAVSAFVVAWLMHGLIFRWHPTRITDEQVEETLGRVATKCRASLLCWFLLTVAIVTGLRLVALRLSVVDLFPDEARYWAWGQTPSFGYFSKPPLIAWVIRIVTDICGNSEACVRTAAPLFYAGTAGLAYSVARRLYDQPTAFWTGLCILLATGVVFSARIMSTDVLLLFFWAAALLAYVNLRDAPASRWFVVLGVALGLGLLAKYAMIYFVLGAICAGLIDGRCGALWRNYRMWLGLGIALLIVSPNLIWNATHDFATFRHTGGNVQGGGFRFDPAGGLGFIASQFAVCGPIVFSVFLIAILQVSRLQLKPADRIMMIFALPPLLLVSVAAFFTSAKANWAAPAAVSMTVLAVAVLVRYQLRFWLMLSVAFGLVVQVVLIAADTFADRVSVSFLPQPDVYRRTMGWKPLAAQVRRTAIRNGIRTIAAESNAVVPTLVYYLRDEKWPIRAWPTASTPMNQFDLDRPLNSAAAEPILFLTDRIPQRLGEYYQTVQRLSPIETATGPHSVRKFQVFKLTGARSEIGPLTTVAR
jgi:4-amino-4-deoxy-L-arabinose transferase-like glycosyltransferase